MNTIPSRSVAAMLCTAGALFVTPAQALPLNEVTLEAPAGNQKVLLKIRTDLTLTTVEKAIQMDVKVITNMADLQAKFDALVKSLPLPRDNCPGFGQHVLPTIESASLTAEGSRAVIHVVGSADVWDCQKNPIREMVVHKKSVNVFGGRIEVPDRIEWRDGSPIKNKLFREGFSATLPIALVTKDGKSIDVVPLSPSVSPRGDLGRSINALAAIFNKDLSSVALSRIDELVDAGVLRKAIPDEFAKYNPTVKSAQFQSEAGALEAVASFSAEVSQDQLSEFLMKALQKQGDLQARAN